MLANLIVYMITIIAEGGMVLAFGIWVGVNRKNEDLEGCPFCGPRANSISLLFWWAGFACWFVVGGSIKIVSAMNFYNIYDTRFKDVEISYSLGSKHSKKEEELTLVVIK